MEISKYRNMDIGISKYQKHRNMKIPEYRNTKINKIKYCDFGI